MSNVPTRTCGCTQLYTSICIMISAAAIIVYRALMEHISIPTEYYCLRIPFDTYGYYFRSPFLRKEILVSYNPVRVRHVFSSGCPVFREFDTTTNDVRALRPNKPEIRLCEKKNLTPPGIRCKKK
uniref:Uncharacterized protein n=1 Tax=Sipha flava TaxID=143950 RepID=A0A2S2PW98_9HEMI